MSSGLRRGPPRGGGVGRARGGGAAGGRRGVVHVVGGDQVDTAADGEVRQRVVAGRVERVAVVPELHRQVLTAEGFGQLLGGGGGGSRTVVEKSSRHGALAAAGEHKPVVTVQLGQL